MSEAAIVTLIGSALGFIQALILFILHSIYRKVSKICENNALEHRELFDARRKLELEVGHINTIHKQKGCDRA